MLLNVTIPSQTVQLSGEFLPATKTCLNLLCLYFLNLTSNQFRTSTTEMVKTFKLENRAVTNFIGSKHSKGEQTNHGIAAISRLDLVWSVATISIKELVLTKPNHCTLCLLPTLPYSYISIRNTVLIYPFLHQHHLCLYQELPQDCLLPCRCTWCRKGKDPAPARSSASILP